LEHNVSPSEIADYTEIPFIINTKSDHILPSVSIQKYNGLCLSIHRHKNNTERVYVSHKSYGSRVFKHNLCDALSPFCNEESLISLHFKWEDEVNCKEFKDPQYDSFINAYFADLEMVKPDLTMGDDDW